MQISRENIFIYKLRICIYIISIYVCIYVLQSCNSNVADNEYQVNKQWFLYNSPNTEFKLFQFLQYIIFYFTIYSVHKYFSLILTRKVMPSWCTNWYAVSCPPGIPSIGKCLLFRQIDLASHLIPKAVYHLIIAHIRIS